MLNIEVLGDFLFDGWGIIGDFMFDGRLWIDSEFIFFIFFLGNIIMMELLKYIIVRDY